MKTSARSCLVAASFLAAIANVNPAFAQTMVGTEAALQTAINNGDTNIELSNSIVLTTPINIGTTSSPTLTINGNGNIITDTGNTSEDFFIQSGTVTIKNTALTGTAYGGNGGVGLLTGGGALGAGGAIFVGSTASVTATNVQFVGNTAGGGSSPIATASGSGGGGGVNGGAGGASDTNGGAGGGGNGGAGGAGINGEGGGGGGLNSAGGLGAVSGGNGGGPNGGVGGIGTGGGTGGANSGGGGGTSGFNGGHGGTNGGGGGGGDGANGGNGGTYAGGGGGSVGGAAGYGGGGGGGYNVGGAGGFGGGGGGSVLAGGTGGTGAGNGNTTTTGQGGGGAGLGGAVFVQAGGKFVATGSTSFSNNTVSQGIGFANGAAVGQDLFITSGATTTLAPGRGKTLSFADTIADDSAASLPAGNGYVAGTGAGGAITIGSSASPGGTVAFNVDNTYSGGTTITNHATLAVGSAGALGSGPVAVTGGTLTVGNGDQFIVASSYTQTTGGTLALNITGSGAAATADRLVITNGSPAGAVLGGTLSINFMGFSIPAGSPPSFEFNVVQTNTGYTDTFTRLKTVDLPADARASIDYSNPDDVFVEINVITAISAAGLTPNEQAPLGAINGALARGVNNPAFAALTHALASLSGATAIGGAAEQLIPLKFNNFASVTAFNDESFEVQEVDTYLAGQRGGSRGTFTGGNGQLDTSGLTLNDPNIDPGLQMIHSRMLAWNAPSATMTDVPSAVLGGVDMKDMKSCSSCATPDNPWNVFVRGTLILAQGLSQPDQPHFDDNTESVVIGADYRFTPNFLVGLTAGYAHTDATLDPANSSATVDSYSPGIYASYADKGWYANAIGRYSYNSYTEQRTISFLGQSANGATDGHEGMADLDGGYDFHAGALTFGPFAGLQYTHLTLNGYQESGSIANLAVDEDESDSLRSRLGGNLRYNFRGCGVIFTPHLTASWQHEFLDPSRGITSQFTSFTSGSFVVRTENPSDDSALVDAGLDAQIDNWITVFGDYLVQAGQSNYFGQAVEAGVKFNF